ncbi:MAG: hypothetical protein K0S29_1191 [Gammaproteobacteria bacterium]|jgi:hypothetical protein|nr:hypothetical protein [Gammaproteobacteria bacterium]
MFSSSITGADKSSTGRPQMTIDYLELETLIKEGNVERVTEILRSSSIDPDHTFRRSKTSTGQSIPMSGLFSIAAARGQITSAWLESLLDTAIIHGQLEIVKLLVERGADIHRRTGYFSAPPLFLAVSLKREDIASYLIGQGADVNFVAPIIIKEFGENTLGIMAERYCCVCPTARNTMTTPSGMEPIPLAANVSILHLAAMAGCSKEMFELLLSNGADANATALLIARTPSEHLYQIWCTRTGLLTQLLSLCNLCAPNIVDHMYACCMPGIHSRTYVDPVTADIPKKAWELLREFHPDASRETIEMLKPSAAVFASRHGAGKEEALLAAGY